VDFHLSKDAYICNVEWVVKHLVSAQALSPVAGGLYEGQLVVWDTIDAHNSVFTRQTKFHIYGEPPVYLDHDYFRPPVGKIVHFSERDDGLYVALKLERPLEDVSGVYLSVGGFAIGSTREDGVYVIEELAVLEASLTPRPAQPNSELVLLMKTLTDMATENEKAPLETLSALDYVRKQDLVQLETMGKELAARVKALEDWKNSESSAGEQATQQKGIAATSALGNLRKQDVAQLEAIVTELMARMEVLEGLQAQVTDIQRRLADLEAAVSQIQGLTQDAVAQSVEKALNAIKEQVQPLAKELAKTMLLVSEALKKTNTQRI
jgi:predicted  nucleic acid-binding Zn-ribbon protein